MKSIKYIAFFIFIYSCNPESNERIGDKGNQRPNFIVLLADDQAWSGTSVQMDTNEPYSKSDYYETPNLERLAQNGVRFSRGYSASPVCSPTRYSIQFGQTPTRLNRRMVKKVPGLIPLNIDTLITIPKMLQSIDSGYYTAHFGKWHLEMTPSAVGYDESDGFTTNREGGWFPAIEHDTVEVRKDPKLTKSLSYHGADFMERMTEWNKPFYLQISYYANHTYVTASEERLKKYQEKSKGKIHSDPHLGAMTEDLDAGVGIILDKLEELGITENTYVIYLADNGSIPSFNPTIEKDTTLNFPLKGGKWDVHEGGIRVPFIVSGPSVQKGIQSNVPIISYDIFPTIADLASKGEFVKPAYFDGGSFSGLLKGDNKESISRNTQGFIFDYPRRTDWAMTRTGLAWSENNHKLIYNLIDSTYSLYNLRDDKSEKQNLITEKPSTTASLRDNLKEYLNETGIMVELSE